MAQYHRKLSSLFILSKIFHHKTLENHNTLIYGKETLFCYPNYILCRFRFVFWFDKFVCGLIISLSKVGHFHRGQFCSLASCTDGPHKAHSDSAARVRKYSELTRALRSLSRAPLSMESAPGQ